MSESTDLATIEVDPHQLAIRRAPDVVLAEAQKAAQALKTVISGKPKPVLFNGEQYLEFEDWQTCGRFYGVTAKVVMTEYVDYGGVKGFTAKAVAIRTDDGFELSAAEADCLNDEEKWRSKPKYEWQDVGGGERKKVKVGDDPVPLFQLKSMAQTRACAKVLRNVLAWVVVLAGYRPTPAEEMDGVIARSAAKPASDGVVEGQVVNAHPEGLPAGAALVTDINEAHEKPNPEKPNKKLWHRFDVSFSDGRKGSTFDTALGGEMKKIVGTPTVVIPVFEPGRREGTTDLKSVSLPPTPAKEVKEPEDGPPCVETILVIRAVEKPDKTWWVVQGSEREYLTDDPTIHGLVVKIKADAGKVVFRYNRVAANTPGKTVRMLTGVDDPAVLTSPELFAEKPTENA